MFQPNFDERPSRDPSARFGKLAFVVADPNDPRADHTDPRSARPDEETEWMGDRLTELYNDR